MHPVVSLKIWSKISLFFCVHIIHRNSSFSAFYSLLWGLLVIHRCVLSECLKKNNTDQVFIKVDFKRVSNYCIIFFYKKRANYIYFFHTLSSFWLYFYHHTTSINMLFQTIWSNHLQSLNIHWWTKLGSFELSI